MRQLKFRAFEKTVKLNVTQIFTFIFFYFFKDYLFQTMKKYSDVEGTMWPIKND